MLNKKVLWFALVMMWLQACSSEDAFKNNITELASIEITPNSETINNGEQIEFRAFGRYTDGTQREITDEVVWQTTDGSLIHLSGASGEGTALKAGRTTITAYGSHGVTASTTVTVNTASLNSLVIVPDTISVPAGTTTQFKAFGLYSDGTRIDVTSQVTWSSGTLATATIDGNGLATTITAGSTQISASLDALSTTASLTSASATLVRVDISPTDVTIPNGVDQQFQALGVFSDGGSRNIPLSWTSSLTSVATVDANGLASSVSVGGPTVITATKSPGVQNDATNLTIGSATLDRLSIAPINPSIPDGLSIQMQAAGVYTDGSTQPVAITWSSASDIIATVDANGLVTAENIGTTDITASFGGQSISTSVTVGPAALQYIRLGPNNPTIPNGTELLFYVNGIYSDGTNQAVASHLVKWTSANLTTAGIDASGKAAGHALGTVEITATLQGKAASTNLTVGNAVLNSLSVTPVNKTVILNTGDQLYTAMGTYTDGTVLDITQQVTWTSSSSSHASIDANQGVASPLAAGSTTITATSTGGITDNTTLTVQADTLSGIEVLGSASNTVGDTVNYQAIGTYASTNKRDLTSVVTWVSSTANMTFSALTAGEASAASAGTSDITATLGATTSPALSVTVAPKTSSCQDRLPTDQCQRAKQIVGCSSDMQLYCPLTCNSCPP